MLSLAKIRSFYVQIKMRTVIFIKIGTPSRFNILCLTIKTKLRENGELKLANALLKLSESALSIRYCMNFSAHPRISWYFQIAL